MYAALSARWRAAATCNQFDQEGDFFAAMPLLQATHWWRDAGVVVLDEFDPTQLTRTVQLTSADLAAMARATYCPHAKAVVRWLAQVLASTTERTLAGSLLYQELEAAADAEGLSFAATLRLAVDALAGRRYAAWAGTASHERNTRGLPGAAAGLPAQRCCACWIASSASAWPGSALPAASKRATAICFCTSGSTM